MTRREERVVNLTRRELFQQTCTGIGSIALGSLLVEEGLTAAGQHDPLTPQWPSLAARAKSIIFLHMVGAPSQLDLYENKPLLKQSDGQPCPQQHLE